MWVLLGIPGWGFWAIICARWRVYDLLLVVLVGEGPGGCWNRHTGGANKRMVCRGTEYTLAHIRRITQNRTGWHLAGQTTNRTPILRQVEGDRGRGLIIIGG